jgi:hypothetical protein
LIPWNLPCEENTMEEREKSALIHNIDSYLEPKEKCFDLALLKKMRSG